MDLHQQQQHLHQRDISMATSAAASTSSLMSQQQQQQQQQHSSLIMGGSGSMQAEDARRVRLRLCYGGQFVPVSVVWRGLAPWGGTRRRHRGPALKTGGARSGESGGGARARAQQRRAQHCVLRSTCFQHTISLPPSPPPPHTTKQTPAGGYRYAGGEFYNESVPAAARYADFLYKLTEKFKTAVSVKYQCPGEDMDPTALITVADDDDFQELKEEYFSHLLRPGTPSKTFRIRCFAFAASEDPLTPDEILLEGGGVGVGMGAGVVGVGALSLGGGGGSGGLGSGSFALGGLGGLAGAQSLGLGVGVGVGGGSSGAPTLDSALEEQAALHGALAAAAGGGGGSDDAERLEMERAALERVRMSVNNLSDFSLAALAGAGGWHGAGGVRAAALVAAAAAAGGGAAPCDVDGDGDEDEEFDAADEAEAEVAAYWGRQAAEMRRAAAAAAASALPDDGDAGSGGGGGVAGSGSSGGEAAARLLPADPFEQEGVDGGAPAPGGALGSGDFEGAGGGGAAAAEEADGAGGGALAAAKAAWGSAPLGGANLPSCISAFGDGAGDEADGEADGEAPAAAGAGGAAAAARGGRGAGAGGYVPRTQDSGFSLEGARAIAAGGGSGAGAGAGAGAAATGAPPARSDSADSLQSLPKLQPVHRLARSEVRVVAKIGEGAFGEVSRAQAPLYGTVAVKWLKSERFSRHSASFWREAALLADLNHPNVLRFYGVITDNGNGGGGNGKGGGEGGNGGNGGNGGGGGGAGSVVGIMTEYVRGGSLAQFLRASRSPLPLRLRCELALQAANGLAYLHELRIVHFDLKPDNLLLEGPPPLVLAAAGAGAGDGAAGGGAAAGGAGAAAAGGAGGGASRAASGGDYYSAPPSGAAAGAAPPAAAAAAAAAAAGGAALAQAVAAGWVPAVKVADFGLSKHKLNAYVSSCRDLRGTLPYMAPELVADPERCASLVLR